MLKLQITLMFAYNSKKENSSLNLLFQLRKEMLIENPHMPCRIEINPKKHAIGLVNFMTPIFQSDRKLFKVTQTLDFGQKEFDPYYAEYRMTQICKDFQKYGWEWEQIEK